MHVIIWWIFVGIGTAAVYSFTTADCIDGENLRSDNERGIAFALSMTLITIIWPLYLLIQRPWEG